MKIKQLKTWRRVFNLLYPTGTVTQQEQFIKKMTQGVTYANQH